MLNLNSVPLHEDLYLRHANRTELTVRLDPFREGEGDLTQQELESLTESTATATQL